MKKEPAVIAERVVVANPAGKLTETEAQIADEEFRKIEEKEGKITPKLIVESARPKASPLHHHFTWDDSKAAERFREIQARQLITSVYVIVRRENEETKPVRAFYSVNTATQELEEDKEEESDKLSGHSRAYVRAEEVARKPGLHQQVVEYAKRQLRSWRQRFGDYKEFAAVVNEIDELL